MSGGPPRTSGLSLSPVSPPREKDRDQLYSRNGRAISTTSIALSMCTMETSLKRGNVSAWDKPATVGGFVAAPPNTTLIDYAARQRGSERALRVLDVGCGAGRNAVPLAQSGARVLGIDLSWPMLSAAAARASQWTPAPRAGADACPAGPRSFVRSDRCPRHLEPRPIRRGVSTGVTRGRARCGSRRSIVRLHVLAPHVAGRRGRRRRRVVRVHTVLRHAAGVSDRAAVARGAT